MISKWTSHLKEPREISSFESSLLGSKLVLERLRAILDENEKQIELTELDARSYDNPSWSHKQAFYNGAKAQIRLIKKLIDLKE